MAKDLLDHGQTLGMSIGYKTHQSRYEPAGAAGKKVRRLLDYELKEYSFAAAQAIAHPQAVVASVKTATPNRTPAFARRAMESTPPHVPSVGSSQWARAEEWIGGHGVKTQAGAADRAARRARVEAERRALDLEERRARSEQELARARRAELGGRLDLLDQECEAQQRSIRHAELSAGLDELDRYLQLARVAEMEIPRSRQDREEGYRAHLDQLDRDSAARDQAEQDARAHHTDACLTRRARDSQYRRRWDYHHPGGPDQCSCGNCAAWRAWRGR